MADCEGYSTEMGIVWTKKEYENSFKMQKMY